MGSLIKLRDQGTNTSDYISNAAVIALAHCEIVILDTCGDGEYIAAAAARSGFKSTRLPGARETLAAIVENPRIGLVVVSLADTAGEGLAMLEQIAARFLPLRALVPLVVTPRITADLAVTAMRLQAADIVQWPDEAGELGEALGRAQARWQQLTRLAKGEWGLGAIDALLIRNRDMTEGERLDDQQLIKVIRSSIATRRAREAAFGPDLFADPAWDILLDLTSARLAGHPVPVLGACAASGVPTSTALRWISKLIEAGHVRRWKDPQDRRRDLMELNDEAFERMRELIGRSRMRYLDKF